MAHTHDYVGFGFYLIRLADYLYGRRGRKNCGNVDDREVHRRDLHPDAVMS
jgi:hypothetical protein